MLIDDNLYLWGRSTPLVYSLTAGDNEISFDEPVRMYGIESASNITTAIYEDAAKTNLIYEGTISYEFISPISCTSLVFIVDNDTDVSIICETGVDKVELGRYMNTTTGMTSLTSGVDDSFYTVSIPFDFYYNNSLIKSIYVSSNNYIGFGSNSEDLKIMRRDGYASSIRYQTGYLRENLQFVKIYFYGYTVYNNRVTANLINYELFLLSNNDLFLNVIQTPTSSNTGTSSMTCGTTVYTYSITDSTGKGMGKLVCFTSMAENGTRWTIEYRPYQEERNATECYLIESEGVYYTIQNESLATIETDVPTPIDFLKHGFDNLPSSTLISTLTNPKILYWRTDEEDFKIGAIVTATPFPQIMTAVADMTHPSILGITDMTAQYGGTVLVKYSVDDGDTYTEDYSLGDFINIDYATLWEELQETKKLFLQFTIYPSATFTSFKINYTN